MPSPPTAWQAAWTSWWQRPVVSTPISRPILSPWQLPLDSCAFLLATCLALAESEEHETMLADSFTQIAFDVLAEAGGANVRRCGKGFLQGRGRRILPARSTPPVRG